MSNLEDLDRRVLWHPFTQMAEWEPLVIDRGEGNYLIDTKGQRYLDGVSSLWCNVRGHNHPRLNRALTDQLARIAHSTFLGLTHEPGIRLAAALVEVAPPGLSRVFYSDSGSTAVEIALKQSFQYWQLRGQPAKQRFLRLGEAYHGDTLGAVGVGGIDSSTGSLARCWSRASPSRLPPWTWKLRSSISCASSPRAPMRWPPLSSSR